MASSIKTYYKAFLASQELLIQHEIDAFPFDLFSFAAAWIGAKVLISTLKDYNSWSSGGSVRKLEISDAKCFYYPERNTYLIVYNETREERRIRFSLAHEFGHIALGHLHDERTEISRGGVDSVIYYHLEGVANVFAGNFLAPPILINEWLGTGRFTTKGVADRFYISPQSVKDYRSEDFDLWKTISPAKCEAVLLRRCVTKLHQRKCPSCDSINCVKDIKYCIMCGSQIPRFSSGLFFGYMTVEVALAKMIYDGIDLKENGRVIECPKCNNEEHDGNANFCKICGSVAVNHCIEAQENDDIYSGCQNNSPLPGNARYCPMCGSESTFLRDGFLKSYNTVKISELKSGEAVPF